MTTLKPCPYCDGSGERMVRKRHKLTNKIIPAVSLCVCSQSRFISSQYPMLDYLSDEYKPIEEVEKSIQLDVDNLSRSPNYLINGTKRCFHLHVKSILMKYRFSEPKARVWFSSSIDIIHTFHVPQSDGHAPHLSSTDTYDLLIVAFGAIEENKALKYGMAQVMANRKNRKPVWIYLPTPTLGGCLRECSPELEEIVSDYKKISVVCGSADQGTEQTRAQKTAEGFTR